MAGVLPVNIQGDSNAQLQDIAAVLRMMPQRVQPELYLEICQIVESTRSYERFVHVSAVPKVQKRTVDMSGGNIASILQTINVDTYEISLEIAGDDYLDDQIAMYAPLAMEIAQSLILAPDELVTTILVTQATSIKCFDGQNFYATNHTWPNGVYTTSQINMETGTGVYGNTIENDFYTALAAMQTWRDDQGRLRIPASELTGPGKLIIQHAPALNQMMHRVFGETKGGEPLDIYSGEAQFSSAAVPFMRRSALAGRAKIYSDGYLSGNSWYLHSIAGIGNAKPFFFLDRQSPEIQVLSKGTEHWAKNRTVLIKGVRRFGLGVARPERSQKVYNA